MTYKTIKYEKVGRLGTITLNRPEVLNALNGEMLEEITIAVRELARDKEVANEVLQLHGGYGYMEEYAVCRIYRDVAAFTIGGGTNEVMREIIAKQSGL